MTEKEIREVLEELGYKPISDTEFDIVNGKTRILGFLFYTKDPGNCDLYEYNTYILVDPEESTVSLDREDIPFKTLDELRRLLV